MALSVVITFPYALGVPGGGPRDCCKTAKHLSLAGAEVALVTVTCHSPNRFPRPQTTDSLLGESQIAELEAAGVDVIRVEQHPVHYMLDGLCVKKALEDFLKVRQVDAILGWHQEVAFLPNYLKANQVIFGMISTMGNALDWYKNSTGFRKIMRDFCVVRPLQQAEVVFARSNFMRDLLSELFRVNSNRVKVSYPGVEPLFAEAERNFSGKIQNFIYYGSLTTEKGIYETLDALGMVARGGRRDWTLKIAGWGQEKHMQEIAWQNGIEDKIIFLGKLEHHELVKELEWAQVAILPSHIESFGLAFAEAQAAGIPVIGYNVGGVPEIVVNGETGWLVEKKRVDLLANAINQAIEHPRKTHEMGLAGRDIVTNNFTWQKTAEVIIDEIATMKQTKKSKLVKTV